MMLRPTAKADRELHPCVQTLTMRQRSVLLLAQRRDRTCDLRRLFNGMGEQIVGELLARGYLAAEDETLAATLEPPSKHDINGIETIHEDP